MAQQLPKKSSGPDWSSGLPELELLHSIGKRVASGNDAASFRSVCSPWRAALPFDCFGPLLLLPFRPESDSITFYSVMEEKAFSMPLPADVRGKELCGVSRGWLALVDEAAAVTLLNPFTGACVELPPADEQFAVASDSPPVSKVEGRWVFPCEDGNNENALSVMKQGQMRHVFFHEIVLSASPYSGRECIAMAVIAHSTEVAFCRVGVDSAWTLLDTNLESSVHSMVICKDKIFAIDSSGYVCICKCNGAGAGAAPTAVPLLSLSPPADVYSFCYLESDGQLHLVGIKLAPFHKTKGFIYENTVVYKCDFLPAHQTPVWSKVSDVGDLTLLLSTGQFHESFSGASVSKFKRNSIYNSLAFHQVATTALEYESINIATDESEKVSCRFSGKMNLQHALCWFRPNIWIGGGLYHEEKSSKEAEPSKTKCIA